MFFSILFYQTQWALATENDGAVLIRLGGEVIQESQQQSVIPIPPPKPITLDLLQTDIAEIVRIFAMHSGQNILLADGVQGTVSVRVTNVPWTDALNAIVQSNGWALLPVGEILMVVQQTPTSK